MSNVTRIDARAVSPASHPVRRRDLDTVFSAQQREQIVVLFHRLHRSIPQIAASFGVGHKAIERALRFQYWRAVGRRQSDRLMGRAA